MRCSNCGWEETKSKERCTKCHTPLIENIIDDNIEDYDSRTTIRANNHGFEENWDAPAKGTLRESSIPPGNMDDMLEKVPTEDRIKITEDIKSTINIFQKLQEKHRISLKPLDPGNESKTIEFEGSQFIINRQNLDPNNPHISSKEQAVLKREDEEWILLDRSQYGTTFILVNRPIAVRKGDVILIGNKRFEIDF